MKVIIKKYPSSLLCNIHDNYMDKKYGSFAWPSYKQKNLGPPRSQPFDEWWREKLENAVQSVYNIYNSFFVWNRDQKVKVRIDRWDTWNMDTTLSYIIVPMLKQLKETTHGHPSELSEEEWNDILDEMIWAFEQKLIDWEDQYVIQPGEFETKDGTIVWTKEHIVDYDARNAHQSRMDNGFILFGRYYEHLWD